MKKGSRDIQEDRVRNKIKTKKLFNSFNKGRGSQIFA